MEKELNCTHCGGLFIQDRNEELCELCDEVACEACGTACFPEDMCSDLCADCYDERERN